MPVEGINGILNVESAALHAPQVGVANTNPQHILSVGSNLYVSGDSPDVLTVDGNVVCEGVKVGLIEIIPSYDLAAVSNVGNTTSNTIQFTNPDTGIVTTGNVSVGKTLTVDGIRITAAAEADVDLDAVVAAGSITTRSIQLQGDIDSTGPYTGTLQIGTNIDAFGGLGVAGNVHVGRGVYAQDLDVDGDAIIRGDLSVLGTTTTIDTDHLRVQDPIIELGKDNAGTGDLGLIMTRPSGSSNVAVIFDEETDTLKIGYTNGGASDTTITMDSAPLSANVNGNLSVTSNLEVGTANLFVDTVSGRVGIGTTSPQDVTHIYKGGGNNDHGLLIEQNNIGTGSATLKFGVAAAAESTAGLSKAGIFFRRADTNGRGDLLFCMDNADDTNDVDTNNHALTIYRNGNVGIGTTSPTTKFTLYGTSTSDEGGLLMKVVDDVNLNNGFTGIGLGGYTTGTTQVAKSAIIHERNAFYGRGNLMFCNSDTADTVDVSNTHARMTITSTGDVGIGTNAPDCRLHLEEPDDISATTKLFHTENGFAGGSVGHFEIVEKKTGAGTGWSDFTLRLQRRVDSTEQGYIEFSPTGTSGDYGTAFGSGATEIMRIDGVNARVGIGVAAPRSPLTVFNGEGVHITSTYNVNSSQYSILDFNYGGGTNSGTPSAVRLICQAVNRDDGLGPNYDYGAQGKLIFQGKTNNLFGGAGNDQTYTDIMTVDGATKNVGIGVTSPDKKLHVNGIVKATNLDLDGTVIRSAANITLTTDTWAKIADFAGLVTGGYYLISIKWSDSSYVGGGTAIWYGGVTYSTYVVGSAAVYNATGEELIKYNAHYHYRDISAFEFIQDSDASNGSYGQHSIYMKSPQSDVVANGVKVTAYRIG